MSSNHIHSFNAWEMERIVGTETSPLNPNYQGTTGDRAFIVRKCATCTARIYSDYGATPEMEQKIWDLVAQL